MPVNHLPVDHLPVDHRAQPVPAALSSAGDALGHVPPLRELHDEPAL
jgi:hypothetical protein